MVEVDLVPVLEALRRRRSRARACAPRELGARDRARRSRSASRSAPSISRSAFTVRYVSREAARRLLREARDEREARADAGAVQLLRGLQHLLDQRALLDLLQQLGAPALGAHVDLVAAALARAARSWSSVRRRSRSARPVPNQRTRTPASSRPRQIASVRRRSVKKLSSLKKTSVRRWRAGLLRDLRDHALGAGARSSAACRPAGRRRTSTGTGSPGSSSSRAGARRGSGSSAPGRAGRSSPRGKRFTSSNARGRVLAPRGRRRARRARATRARRRPTRAPPPRPRTCARPGRSTQASTTPDARHCSGSSDGCQPPQITGRSGPRRARGARSRAARRGSARPSAR